MQSAKSSIACLPLLAFIVTLGCSDPVEGDFPLGSGGSGSVASAGSSGLPASGAGTGPGTAGATSVAGATGSAGAANGASGSGVGGALSQGGSGGSLGQAGSSASGAGGGGVVPTDGKGLYEVNCKACHGEQGAGGMLASAIVHPVRDYSTWVVRNGRPLIAPWPKAMDKFATDKLSDAQLTLIWNYLDEPAQPTTGPTLYADYCANCHGADGAGGPTMRKLAGEGKNVLKLVREGKSVGQYAMRHDSMPKFDTKRITDAELNLILAHVNTF